MAGQGAIIGIDATAALTQGGGIGRYTRELIRALVAEAPHNHYTLFSAPAPALPAVPDPRPGAANAALFAAALLANESPELRQRLGAFRGGQTEVARNMALPPAA